MKAFGARNGYQCRYAERGMDISEGVWCAERMSVPICGTRNGYQRRRLVRGMDISVGMRDAEWISAKAKYERTELMPAKAKCRRSVRLRRQNARPVNRIAILFNLNVRFLSTKNWGYFHRRYGYLAKPKVYEIKRTFFFSSGGVYAGV